MTRRTERVNVLLREEISQLLSQQLRDPRLPQIVSITHVEASVNLKYARVFVSVMGTSEDKAAALAVLGSASGFLRKELKSRLALRDIPELHFVLDETIERADRVLRLMDSLRTPKPSSGQ